MSEIAPAESSKRSRSPETADNLPNKKQAADSAASTDAPSISAAAPASAPDAAVPKLTEEEAAMSGAGAPASTPAPAGGKVNHKKAKLARAYQGKKKDWDENKPRPGRNNETKKKDGSDDEAEGGEGDGVKRLPKKKAAIMLGLATFDIDPCIANDRYCGAGYSGMQMYVPSL